MRNIYLRVIGLFFTMFASLAMFGQQTLTIYPDGTGTSSQVPIYGSYSFRYLKCEYVIPANQLTAMEDGTISKMTFYLSSPASSSWGGANFQVFLKQVDNTSISSYYGPSDATIVYEGSLDGTQSTMDVVFSTPYTYNGGNLWWVFTIR